MKTEPDKQTVIQIFMNLIHHPYMDEFILMVIGLLVFAFIGFSAIFFYTHFVSGGCQ